MGTKTVFEQKCIRAGLTADEIEDAIKYKVAHSKICDEDIILHYRPELLINILGELIYPDMLEEIEWLKRI